jgi:NAD(P)-dependent dehydrogenase (short-subunit alcohol dehydrogenase family)
MKRTSLVLQMLAGVAAAGAAYLIDAQRRRSESPQAASSTPSSSSASSFRSLFGANKSSSKPENRIVLVTGGSRGLGYAIAERFGRAGNRLVLAARNFDDLVEARNSLVKHHAVSSPDDVLLIPTDLTDAAQAASLIEHAIQHFGRIDVLVNNAGIMEVGPVEDQPLEAYRRAMATNFFSALNTIHAALPYLLQRDRRNPAAIVNVCSIGGKVAVPHMLPYTASKFALVGFSQGLHAELRHKGVRVTTVCPGLMRTGGHHHASFTGDQKREARWFNLAATTPIVATSVKNAANQIYDAVAQGRAEITITPQAYLAARFAGIAPEATQRLTSLANEFILPQPLAASSPQQQEKTHETKAQWSSSAVEQPAV